MTYECSRPKCSLRWSYSQQKLLFSFLTLCDAKSTLVEAATIGASACFASGAETVERTPTLSDPLESPTSSSNTCARQNKARVADRDSQRRLTLHCLR